MSGSIRPPFPSAPSDPALRRLGVGPSAGHSRPIRAQLIVVVVLGLMLLAVPLYLWRRPSLATKSAAESSALPSASAAPAVVMPIAAPNLPDAGVLEPERVKLSQIRKVRCGASSRQSSGSENCDSLAFFEKALTDAVKLSADCGPRSPKPGSISFVLEIDFTRKHLHVFPGASGDFHGPKARRTTKCVQNAMPSPDWAAIVHQHRYYAIALLATYAGARGE
jgi:hypothetical protein